MRLFVTVKVVGRCRRTTQMTSTTTESTIQQRQTTTKAATTTTGHCLEQKSFIYHNYINKFRDMLLQLSLCSSVLVWLRYIFNSLYHEMVCNRERTIWVVMCYVNWQLPLIPQLVQLSIDTLWYVLLLIYLQKAL